MIKKWLWRKISLAALCVPVLGFLDNCDPEEICLQTADIVAKTSLRCDPHTSYETHRQNFINRAALGSCKTIKEIRDAKALLNDCLPWLEEVSCDILNENQKLPACENQLLLQPTSKSSFL